LRTQPEKKSERDFGKKGRQKQTAVKLVVFLRPSLKKELFAFLSSQIASLDCPEEKEIVDPTGTTAIALANDHAMDVCDHEETETRLLVNVRDALQNNCSTFIVCTVDADVVVILMWGNFRVGKEVFLHCHQHSNM